MYQYTNRSLLISLGLHIVLTTVVVSFLIQPSEEVRDTSAMVLLEAAPVQRMRQPVLHYSQPPTPQANRVKATKPSTPSLALPTNAVQGAAPQAPIHLDVAPVLVTYADLSEMDASALPNSSLGKSFVEQGVGIGRGQGTGIGRPGGGGLDGNGIGQRFANFAKVEDLALEDLSSAPTGLGIFGTTVMPGHGLVGTVYVPDASIIHDDHFLRCFTPSGAIIQVPTFEHLTPAYTFVTGTLDISPRNYKEGFPISEMETVVDNFAIRFHGRLAIEAPGTYAFALNSDDGSKLYINQNLIVDNDGIHPPRYVRGSLELEAGMHYIEIHYFQGQPYQLALQWFYQPPNGQEQIVPPEMVYLPEPPRAPRALEGLRNRLKRIENKEMQ